MLTRIVGCVLVVAVVLCAGRCPIWAEPAPDSSIKAELSVPAGGYTLGEPVLATLTVTDGGGGQAGVETRDAVASLVIEAADPHGLGNPGLNSVTWNPQFDGSISLDPGPVVRKELILNDWCSFRRPGVYHARWRLYVSTIRTLESGGRLSACLGPVDAGVFTVTIREHDEWRLQTLCRAWLEEIIRPGAEPQKQTPAAHRLASVQDNVAVPFIAEALRHRLTADGAAWLTVGLGRIGTEDARNVLKWAAHSSDQGVAHFAQRQLDIFQGGHVVVTAPAPLRDTATRGNILVYHVPTDGMAQRVGGPIWPPDAALGKATQPEPDWVSVWLIARRQQDERH
jgi:hypothetical protein